MKKFLIMFGAIIALFVISASAVTIEEVEEDIEYHQNLKRQAHQMAECARFLGYDEDSVIIQEAKSCWNHANEVQINLKNALEELKNPTTPVESVTNTWTGSKLTRSKGVNYGPTGKETYYNLPMQGVVNIMRNKGYDAATYPYWVRSDGCKMLGDYIMVAANLQHFPRGTIVQCSLGAAIVCDTGGFASRSDGWNWLDIATNW